MEPMNLGSPTSPTSSPYLPSFLMGEQQTPTTPRNNSLSPNKAAGRRLSFGFTNSPNGSSGLTSASTQDYGNRSILEQKTLFGGYQQTPTSGQNATNYIGTVQNLNISGPPIQGLFDSLRNESNLVPTPLRAQQTNTQQLDRSCVAQRSVNFALNQSMQPQQLVNLTGPINDSLLGNNASLNLSHGGIMSPIMHGDISSTNATNLNTSQDSQFEASPRFKKFWVTVYGFPSTAISIILQHFSQCGTIVDTVMPSQNANWLHLKYSSRIECNKALNYDRKILAGNIMIGVTQCEDKGLIDKENTYDIDIRENVKDRPLVKRNYNNAWDVSTVRGHFSFVHKALDLFFGR